MSIIVPDTIEVVVLDFLLKTQNLVIRLFSNNIIPTDLTVIGDFTQVTGGGYSAITLTAANWVITQGSPSYGVYAQQTFTFTGTIGGSGNVYGYYVTNVAGTVLYWSENLPGAISPFTPSNGSYIRITPRFEAS